MLKISRVLAEVPITSLNTLKAAIAKLHARHRIPHIIVTSVSFDDASPILSVVGSTRRTDGSPRFFKIDVPRLDCFFSGTGDMFAALMVVRLREAITTAQLGSNSAWLSPDNVEPLDLPLAKAGEKALGSMHAVLAKTMERRDQILAGNGRGPMVVDESEHRRYLRETKAAEVQLVRNLEDLRHPIVRYKAEALGEEDDTGTPRSHSTRTSDVCFVHQAL